MRRNDADRKEFTVITPPAKGDIVMRSAYMVGLLLCVATSAFADQAFLSNGDRISGSIRLAGETATVTSPIIGEVKLPRKAIVRILMEQPTDLLIGKEKFTASAVSYSGGSATLEIEGGKTVSVSSDAIFSAPAQASALMERSLLSPWKLFADAGFTAARGNTVLNNLHFGFNAIETTDKHRLNLLFSSLLAQNRTAPAQVATTFNTIRGGARYEFNVAQRLFAFGLTNFESNELQQLDLRSVVGGGFGWRITERPAVTLDVFTGSTFDNESYSKVSDRNSGELLAGQELMFKLTSRTSIAERFVAFPKFTDPGQYRVNFDSSAIVMLNSWLGWQTNITDTYVSDPVIGSRNNDVIVTTGMRFTFGKERVFKPRPKVMQLPN